MSAFNVSASCFISFLIVLSAFSHHHSDLNEHVNNLEGKSVLCSMETFEKTTFEYIYKSVLNLLLNLLLFDILFDKMVKMVDIVSTHTHEHYLILESQFLRDTEWLMRSFEEGFRLQSVLITAPDVLQPNVLKKVHIYMLFIF